MPGTGFNSVATRVSPVRTASFTADTEFGLVLCDATSGAIVATLPDAKKAFENQFGARLTFKRLNSGANAVTLTAVGSQTIDGAATLALGSQYAFATIQSDGSNWHVVAS
jgi:hypothetical protein